MTFARLVLGVLFSLVALSAQAQDLQDRVWDWRWRGEVRLNARDSFAERFQLRFPFLPIEITRGQTANFLETVEPGSHLEASLASLNVDLTYGEFFAARAKFDAIDLYDRNPTSEDRAFDFDELWVRFGSNPPGLEMPAGTSFFIQAGKAPKIERQPVRLLESYGVTSTAFNRFEDVQLLAGGSVGRHLYWRAQLSNGNPVFIRDTNALAGDNGIAALRQPNPDPELKSGFPILYDAESEGLVFKTGNMETGGGIGYRIASEGSDDGFDLLFFYYQRDLADTVELEGTFYGGDLDLLDGVRNISLPIEDDQRSEGGGRAYVEWGRFTGVAQVVKQTIAGMDRTGYEAEFGAEFPVSLGFLSFIQPALRWSLLDNHFRGPATFVAPSVWWDWTKVDAGVRIGIREDYDLTIEHAFHEIEAPVDLDLDETLITLRVRFGS